MSFNIVARPGRKTDYYTKFVSEYKEVPLHVMQIKPVDSKSVTCAPASDTTLADGEEAVIYDQVLKDDSRVMSSMSVGGGCDSMSALGFSITIDGYQFPRAPDLAIGEVGELSGVVVISSKVGTTGYEASYYINGVFKGKKDSSSTSYSLDAERRSINDRMKVVVKNVSGSSLTIPSCDMSFDFSGEFEKLIGPVFALDLRCDATDSSILDTIVDYNLIDGVYRKSFSGVYYLLEYPDTRKPVEYSRIRLGDSNTIISTNPPYLRISFDVKGSFPIENQIMEVLDEFVNETKNPVASFGFYRYPDSSANEIAGYFTLFLNPGEKKATGLDMYSVLNPPPYRATPIYFGNMILVGPFINATV